MYIVHIASEFAPIAKAGGLGDVLLGLCKEQQKKGHRVEVILPKYDILQHKHIENFTLAEGNLWSFEDASRYHNSVYSGFVNKIKLFFIEPHHNQYYFSRTQIYGTDVDVEKFLYFSRTSLEFLYTQGKRPDIIHLHDWPTGACAPLMKTLYKDLHFGAKAIVFTIHNLEHQGRCPPRNLTRVGLRGEDFRTYDRFQDPNDPSKLNLLKAGIVYSDFVTTVSPKYAEEIERPEHGFGLDGVISHYKHKLRGILNGIDLETWNPSTDPFISHHYPPDANQMEIVLKEKQNNRHTLLKSLRMEAKGPIVASITRIAQQKGPWLLQNAIHHILKNGGSFILLGSSLDPHLEREFLHIKAHYKSHPNLHIGLEFDEALAHQIYAGADAILIPSLFEPCGLTQMISMRYATLPIVRKTGGLADTVFDVDDPHTPKEMRNGFAFYHTHEHDLQGAINRMFHTYYTNQGLWMELMQNGLRKNVGWKASEEAYEACYQEALRNAHPRLSDILTAVPHVLNT